MIKELWLNFPSKNLSKTIEFFTKIGFTLKDEMTNEGIVCFEVGSKKTPVLFFPEEVFEQAARHEIAPAESGSQVMISFDAESREEVDETARRVFEAGGTIFAAPSEIQGWMYGFAFTDLDGQRWNQIYMDFSQKSQG